MLPFEVFATEKKWVDFTLTGPPHGSLNGVPPWVRDLKGWLMSRNNFVKVHSFSGATTEYMESYLIPLINKKPDHILLHVGTKNLAFDTPEVIVKELL